MSISSFSGCIIDSKLLCDEDSSGIFSGGLPEYSSDFESPASSEDSIASFIEDERHFVPGIDYFSRFQSQSLDSSARADSIAWILKVQAYYGFQPLTAYLSVNYLDRFLYSRRLPGTSGWLMQLLSVACLSLAAKMEEPLVPSFLELQIEGAKYIFEPRTVRRMELLVLTTLNWRLRSVTPFSFIGFFSYKVDPTRSFSSFLNSRFTEIILSNIRDASLLEYWPSCIAAAALLCASNEIPNLTLFNPEHAESWCNGLSKEKIIRCYRLMQPLMEESPWREPPKVIPQLRVMVRAGLRYSDSSSSFSSSSRLPFKRRKLNNCVWVEDDKENSKLRADE